MLNYAPKAAPILILKRYYTLNISCTRFTPSSIFAKAKLNSDSHSFKCRRKCDSPCEHFKQVQL